MKRSYPYINASATKDSSEPTHMSCEQLEASLTEIGIKVPANLPKIVLRKLLIENMNTASTDVPQIVENDNADTGTIFVESPPVQTCDLPTTCMQRINSGLPSGDIVSDDNALLHSSSAASLSGSNDMNTILGALTSVTQCFSNLQETVTQLLKSQQKEKQLYDVNGFNLQQWYSNTPAIPNPQPPENTVYQGVRSDSYTNVDIVSPHLQKQIIEGKDINLASLLINYYECHQKRSISTESLEVQLSGKPDPRLNRSLSISEFLKAFGKYKRVMTSVYPDQLFCSSFFSFCFLTTED